MDYHQHHQPWRPRPPIQGTICPTCSFPHFPFCPPPPSFNQNPTFPLDPDHAFHRPGFDPYHQPTMVMQHQRQHPVMANSNNGGFGNPGLYPGFDRGSMSQFGYTETFAPQSYQYGGNGYGGDDDRSHKRPRVDDYGSGEFNNSNYSRVSSSSDDERRLKMIRDHGGGQGEVSVPGFAPVEDRRDNRNGFHSEANHGEGFGHPNLLESGRAESSGNEPPYSYNRNFASNYHKPQHHHGMQHPIPSVNEPRGYFPRPAGEMGPRFLGAQPPLPPSPPPPLPIDPPLPGSSELKAYSLQQQRSPSLFPVPVTSSAMVGSSCSPIPEAQSRTQTYFHTKSFLHSTGFATQDSQAIHGTMPKQFAEEDRSFLRRHSSSDKPTVVDASQLFKKPHRTTRPDHFVIILRGLPGSGKSYLAKMLRDVEVENGGAAPRIHSMDDYFVTEVEKVEESDISKSSGTVRGKKPVIKKVMEYCYEPEMEEAYRSSMLKAFKKTLEEGDFTFIIVDDRNLRVADFSQFWAIAKSSGYEVYVLEASYKDPAGCAARNVHGFMLEDIEKMAKQWEEAPSFHLRLDVKSLFNGDDLKKSGIQEVDMAMEDEDPDEFLSGLQGQNTDDIIAPPVRNDIPDDSPKDGKSWNVEVENRTEVKELGRSKWSNELDEDDTDQTEPIKGNLSALSGLIQAYGKEAKSVRWGDQGGHTGFSLSATKKAHTLSLVIGPGVGYNLKSNPLHEEDRLAPTESNGGPKRQSLFQEQLQAERESFKAVFFRRQQRIGLDLED
ncbi:YLP motif-containing protein [Parasponia andersonii]|uniref:YLP motif-containing protein n=1 Tax=Parasponia andersonii TaxID=3476 RepID=A0A2P5ADT0_PARAD|nr:YLP motif-containing protein [Parasponia andersonii]